MMIRRKNEAFRLDFWTQLWQLLTPFHRKIKSLFILIILLELAKFASPYLLKLIIDNITNLTPERLGLMVVFVISFFAANQFVSLIDYFVDRYAFDLLAATEKRLAVNAQEKMVMLDLRYHEKENTGSKISKIQRGIDKITDLIANMSWDVVPTVVQILLTTILVFVVDWRFGAIFIFFVPIFAFLSLRLNKLVTPARRKRHDMYEKSSGRMAQSIININTVKSFVQEKREIETFSRIAEKVRTNWIFEMFYVFKYNLGRNFVIDSGRACMLAFGVYLVWQGSITVGSLVFIVTISEKALFSLFRISRLYDRMMDSSEAIIRLSRLQVEKPLVVNPSNGVVPKKITGQIKFKNVSFAYQTRARDALHNITVEIPAGCATALVGPSGGGKTTVARMIYRHYDPQQGTVLLDDLDLKQYDLYALRRLIAIVPQEVEIFDASVRDNIAYAKSQASSREVRAAAKIANADEFIDKLKDGYETMVGERGIRLSGGQKQRVGIARAVLAAPKILIFDEATSNLDSYSESLIQEAIGKISQGRTMIIIAHRLSTIKRADKIIVLEKGRVVEIGNHYELASKQGGVYAKLLALQKMGNVC